MSNPVEWDIYFGAYLTILLLKDFLVERVKSEQAAQQWSSCVDLLMNFRYREPERDVVSPSIYLPSLFQFPYSHTTTQQVHPLGIDETWKDCLLTCA